METERKELKQVLRMKGGIDDESYTHNSKPQAAYLSLTTQVIKEAVCELADGTSLDTISIADLGCSSGPNSLFAVSEIVNTFYKHCLNQSHRRQFPEFQVFLNDLPGNDFNTVFASLPKFYGNIGDEFRSERIEKCYIYGVPGTFFGRLFPCKSLHFVHSSSSLHWLSQVPPELCQGTEGFQNKGKVYISKTSPPSVLNAYFNQFQRDFNQFLKFRSKEVAPEGRMVLMFKGRRVEDPCHEESCLLWDFLGQAFQDMVSQGLISEDMLDCYNTPYYEPYTEDIKSEIQKEGSFTLHRLETIVIPWSGVLDEEKNDNRLKTAKLFSKTMKAVHESMIRNHFGQEIIDPLFKRLYEIIATDKREVEHVSVIVSLIRKSISSVT